MKYIPLTDVRYLIVHCAATPPHLDVGVKEIDRWHRERGFFSIGYHYVVRRDGTVEAGRPLDQPGAHARGYNNQSRGVCLVGGVDKGGPEGQPEANFTLPQLLSLATILTAWKDEYPNAEIIGHRDVDSGKACPSFDVRAWVAGGMIGLPPTKK